MNIIYRNLFAKLRNDNFDTHEQLEPMSAFKMQKLMGLMKNIADMPAGEVELNNSMLNTRFKRMQQRAATQHTTSRETIYLVRIIISNLNATLTHGISVRVHPALVPNDHPLASVHGAYNAVLVEAESAGRLMFYGQGAGGAPTASAVLSDVVAAAAHRVHGGQAPRESSYAHLPVLGPESAVTRYQIQLRSDDSVGSLAAMASVFAENGVSINSVRQSAYVTADGSEDQAVVTFVTHPAPVFHLDAAVEGLRSSDRVAEVVSIQRVEGE